MKKIDKINNEKSKEIKNQEEQIFFEEVLKIQKQLNKIQINSVKLEENGFYNIETIDAIKQLQGITDFEQNGVIDQNLNFRLNEIIDHLEDKEIDSRYTFALLYRNYKHIIQNKPVLAN